MFLRSLISINGLSPISWAPDAIGDMVQGFPKRHPWLHSNTHIRGLRKDGAKWMDVALYQCFKAKFRNTCFYLELTNFPMIGRLLLSNIRLDGFFRSRLTL